MQEVSSVLGLSLKDIHNQQSKQSKLKQSDKIKALKSSLTFLDLKKNISIETNNSQTIISEPNFSPSPQFNKLSFSSIKLFQKKVNAKVQSKNSSFPSSFKLIDTPKLEKNKQNNPILASLLEFNFSVLSYSIQDLIKFSSQILDLNKFCQTNYSNGKIKKLVTQLASNYNDVPYHNFSHAFSLMLLNFQCLQRQDSIKKHLSQQQKFCIIIAGLSHDINHNGTNNMYEIKSKSKLAIQFNNESVLQNMHASTLWKILDKNPELNFLNFCQNKNSCKKFITGLILSTDMAHHFKNLELLQTRKSTQIDYSKPQQKKFIIQQLFHACDIGNSTLQYQLYITWSSLLSYQFNSQFKLQQQNGLEPTVMFQYKGISNFYKDQLWFVGKIALPIWKQITTNFSSLQILLHNMNKNIQKLNQKLTEEELIQRS